MNIDQKQMDASFVPQYIFPNEIDMHFVEDCIAQ